MCVCVCVALNQEQKKIHLSPVLIVGKSFICSHNRIEYISMPKRIDSCSMALIYVCILIFFVVVVVVVGIVCVAILIPIRNNFIASQISQVHFLD